MVRMPTALAVIGIVVIILGTWMMMNEVHSGKRTFYAGLILEAVAAIMILVRRRRKV